MIWLYLSLTIVFLVVSAFFSSAETAFASLNKYRFKVQAENGSKIARRIIRIYEDFDLTLVTVLIGNNLFSIAMSTLSTLFFLDVFSSVIPNQWVISLIASLVMTLILYVFGETLPKVIAKRIPDRVARISVYPLYFFIVVFYPLAMLFRFILWAIAKMLKTKDKPELTEEDFTNVVETIEKRGLLETNEKEIIKASFDFADTSVKQVLTPKNRMFEIDLKGLTHEKLAKILEGTNYSRIPMYFGNDDKIVGILIVKKYLAAYLRDPNVPVFSTLEKPYLVSPKIMMDDMIDGFRSRQTQVAIVVQDKELIGMVTAEDVLEELVGNISEENPEEQGDRR